MKRPSLVELERLMSELMLPFYDVERNAVLPVERRRFENDVEHSWSVAFLACSLAPQVDPTLDLGKIAQFGLVHDLVEVHAGDTQPWGDPKLVETKEAREATALARIEREFGHFAWITQTIHEYERRATPEARYVWAVDKLIILIIRHLDRGRYYVEAKVDKRLWDSQRQEHRRKAHAHTVIGDYYDELLEIFDAHPEYFYRENG